MVGTNLILYPYSAHHYFLDFSSEDQMYFHLPLAHLGKVKIKFQISSWAVLFLILHVLLIQHCRNMKVPSTTAWCHQIVHSWCSFEAMGKNDKKRWYCYNTGNWSTNYLDPGWKKCDFSFWVGLQYIPWKNFWKGLKALYRYVYYVTYLSKFRCTQKRSGFFLTRI